MEIPSALRGVGDCWIPMIMTAQGVCVLRVVWILIAVPIRPDILTVVFSYPLTWTITTVLFNIYYYFFSALKKWNAPLPWKKKRRIIYKNRLIKSRYTCSAENTDAF